MYGVLLIEILVMICRVFCADLASFMILASMPILPNTI